MSMLIYLLCGLAFVPGLFNEKRKYPEPMKKCTFTLRFRFDSADWHETTFPTQLSDEEEAFVKNHLKENEYFPYWAFEFDCPSMFERLMEAHMDAVVAFVNKDVIAHDRTPFTKETVD